MWRCSVITQIKILQTKEGKDPQLWVYSGFKPERDNIPLPSPAAAPDVYELLLKEERMLHSDKHVAGITFRFTLLFYEIYKSSLLLISHLTESKK